MLRQNIVRIFNVRPKPSCVKPALGGYFLEEVLNKSTIYRVIQDFNKQEPEIPIQVPRAQQEQSKIAEEIVIGAVHSKEGLSSRKIGASMDYSKPRVLQVLHKHKFKPFQLHAHQELIGNDYGSRNTFCEQILEKCDPQNNF